jgi:hypothetical protein
MLLLCLTRRMNPAKLSLVLPIAREHFNCLSQMSHVRSEHVGIADAVCSEHVGVADAARSVQRSVGMNDFPFRYGFGIIALLKWVPKVPQKDKAVGRRSSIGRAPAL